MEEDYNTTSELLNQSVSVCESWITTCQQLTQIFWPNYSLHTWTDTPHTPENLQELISRLKEVLAITPFFVVYSYFLFIDLEHSNNPQTNNTTFNKQ